MIRSLIPLALVSILGSCSVSQDQEVALGRQNAEEINAQLPIVTDPAISGYIQNLGHSIAKTTSRADLCRWEAPLCSPGTGGLGELQADSEGVVNVTRAGYDPQGIPDLFQVLLKERQYQPPIEAGLRDYSKRATPRANLAAGFLNTS